MKFESLYNEYTSQLDEAAPIGSVQQTNQAPAAATETAGQNVQPQVPAPQEVKEPQPDVTSEGKRFLVELALKALGVGPENLSATDKEIFTQKVTQENADQLLSRIQSIVDLYS